MATLIIHTVPGSAYLNHVHYRNIAEVGSAPAFQFRPVYRSPLSQGASVVPFSTELASCYCMAALHRQHYGLERRRVSRDLCNCNSSISPNHSGSTRLFFAINDDTNNNENKTARRHGRNRKERFAMEANENNNIVAKILESSIGFLFRRVPFPLSVGNRGIEKPKVPLVYPLTVLASATIFPFVTSAILTISFTLYLALGMAFMDEYDDLNLGSSVDYPINNQNNYEVDEFFGEDYERESQGVVPLAALAGAVASAGLLSPQGFVSSNGAVSLASPAALLTLGLGFVALFGGIWGFDDVNKQWQVDDMQEQVRRSEREKLDQWDEKIRKK